MAVFDPVYEAVLGGGSEDIRVVDERAQRMFPSRRVIVWEGDAQTFQFTYVSECAAATLGYPCEWWIDNATFWADHVVLPEDRDDAVAYCALATARRRDHVFEYRARTRDGKTVVLRDVVRVVLGPRGVASRLRGLMFDITEERQDEADLRAAQSPTRAELEAMAV